MRHVVIAVLFLLGALPAQAQALWVGNWYRVPEASRRSVHSFRLTVRPDGALRYDDGGAVLVIAASGKATPEPFLPKASILTLDLTPTSFSYQEMVDGRPVVRIEERLSADETRLIGRRVSIATDGRERAEETEAVRVGAGYGLAGRWRALPSVPGGAGSTVQQPASPFWVITHDAAGSTVWTIPRTGEVLQGIADGRHRDAVDGLRLAGRTYTLKAVSPRHLRWSFYETGHLIEQADERLSADGKRWTDLIWKVGYPREKDRFVYRRE